MGRTTKWTHDAHSIRERAARSRTETWSRVDLERLFEVSRASAQTLMKAIGSVEVVGGTHFVDRASLLSFLDEVIAADSVEAALRGRKAEAVPVSRSGPLRKTLPEDLRRVTAQDLPANIQLTPGELRITGPDAEAIVEGLLILAQAMQNDLEAIRARLDPAPLPSAMDEELKQWFAQKDRFRF